MAGILRAHAQGTRSERSPLHRPEVRSSGKYKNNDALGLRFDRLLEEVEIKDKGKSFKTLRATSASFLGNSEKYRPYGPLFLGHAPDGVFQNHYLQEDCKVLNEGVGWLRQKVLACLQ